MNHDTAKLAQHAHEGIQVHTKYSLPLFPVPRTWEIRYVTGAIFLRPSDLHHPTHLL
jgi:hypothetical protein